MHNIRETVRIFESKFVIQLIVDLLLRFKAANSRKENLVNFAFPSLVCPISLRLNVVVVVVVVRFCS